MMSANAESNIQQKTFMNSTAPFRLKDMVRPIKLEAFNTYRNIAELPD